MDEPRILVRNYDLLEGIYLQKLRALPGRKIQRTRPTQRRKILRKFSRISKNTNQEGQLAVEFVISLILIAFILCCFGKTYLKLQHKWNSEVSKPWFDQ